MLNSFLDNIINLSINDFIKQLLPEPVSPIIIQDSPFWIFNSSMVINIFSLFVPIFASEIFIEYFSSFFLVILDFFSVFILR